MLKIRMLPLAMALLLASCQTPSLDNSFCKLARPIYMSRKDSVTGDTARQILAHDDLGQQLCGWPSASQ